MIDYTCFCRDFLWKSWHIKKSTEIGGDQRFGGASRRGQIRRRKYNRGRIVEGQWIFGGMDSKTKHVFYVAVEDRTKETFLVQRMDPSRDDYSEWLLLVVSLCIIGKLHTLARETFIQFCSPWYRSSQKCNRTWMERLQEYRPRHGCKIKRRHQSRVIFLN